MTDAVTAVRRALAETFARLAVHSQLEVERRAIDSPERLRAVAQMHAYRHAQRVVSPLGDDVPALGEVVREEWRVSHVVGEGSPRSTWTYHESRERAVESLDEDGHRLTEARVDSRLVTLWPVEGDVPSEWPRVVGEWSAVEST